jgi:hypothetical protein
MVEIDRDMASQQIFRFGVSRNGPVISVPPAKRGPAAGGQTGRRDHRHPRWDRAEPVTQGPEVKSGNPARPSVSLAPAADRSIASPHVSEISISHHYTSFKIEVIRLGQWSNARAGGVNPYANSRSGVTLRVRQPRLSHLYLACSRARRIYRFWQDGPATDTKFYRTEQPSHRFTSCRFVGNDVDANKTTAVESGCRGVQECRALSQNRAPDDVRTTGRAAERARRDPWRIDVSGPGAGSCSRLCLR